MSAREQGNAGVIGPPPLIYAGPLLLGLLLHKVRPQAVLPRRLARLLGWPLVCGGIAGGAWFIATLRQAGTPPDPRQPVTRLVTWGPFRFSRNPAYTSFTMLYVGIAALVNTLWPLLWLPAVLQVMRKGVIEREERYLTRRFGDEYAGYKARVRRWL